MIPRFYSKIGFIISVAVLLSCDSETIETVTFISVPSLSKSSEPNLHKADDDSIYLSWIDALDDNNSSLNFSTLTKNDTWSTPKVIAKGNEWFVNWADFPSITSFGKQSLAAHYLEKSAKGTYTYDVKLTLSNDNGNTWSKAIMPHTDNTNSEHGFVSKVDMNNGTFLTAWLDGRQYAYSENDSTITKEMTLRAATIDKDGILSQEFLLDERVCDCCQTDAAMTKNGPIIVYRDRSKEEIRDIYYVRQINDEWTKPKPLYNDEWKIAGCPVNGPAITTKDNTVAVAWYTLNNNSPKVKVAFSNNNGETFNIPLNLGDINSLGRVDIELLNDKSALVSWLDNVNDNTVIRLQRIYQDGTLSHVVTLDKSSENRSSGFPRMVIKDDVAYFAWTNDKDGLIVKSAMVQIERIK